MPRVKGGVVTRKRRKKTLKLAKGYFGSKHILYRTAHEQVMRSLRYAYRDRKQTKRNFRKLWITRINAACRFENISYSKFMHGLKLANIEVDRKMLADLAVNDIVAFNSIVALSKDALANKNTNPAVAVEAKKEAPKKAEAKKEAPKKVEAKKEEPKKAEVKKEEPKKVEVKEEPKKVEVKEEPKKVEVKEEKETADSLGKLTVAQLRELAKERNITIPSGARKADIIELIIAG